MSEEQIVRALVNQAETYPAGVFGEIGSWDEITAVVVAQEVRHA
jgi:hypothetical protein